MKWVLNSYQTAQNWPVERILEVCKETGYEGVEFLQDFTQPHGVRVSIEAHGSFTDPLYAVRVVREAALPNVGIVFNSQWRVGAESGWSLPPGARSIAPLYDLLAPYITSVHTHQMEQPEV